MELLSPSFCCNASYICPNLSSLVEAWCMRTINIFKSNRHWATSYTHESQNYVISEWNVIHTPNDNGNVYVSPPVSCFPVLPTSSVSIWVILQRAARRSPNIAGFGEEVAQIATYRVLGFYTAKRSNKIAQIATNSPIWQLCWESKVFTITFI